MNSVIFCDCLLNIRIITTIVLGFNLESKWNYCQISGFGRINSIFLQSAASGWSLETIFFLI